MDSPLALSFETLGHLIGRHGDTPEEMGEESEYQNGMKWMRRPVEEWPVKKTVNPPPMEECSKDMLLAVPRAEATTEAVAVQAVDSAKWPLYPPRTSSLTKLT